MKKLIVLFLCLAGVAAFAAPEKFLGWKTTDVAAVKAQLAKDDAAVPPYYKVLYTYMLAKLEAPDTVDTLAKTEAVVGAAHTKYKVEKSVTSTVLGIVRNSKDYKLLDDISKDKRYTEDVMYKIYFVVLGIVAAPEEEVKTTAFECSKYLCSQNKCQPNLITKVLDKYIQCSSADDDEVVVKNLRVLYRLVLPKLTGVANDPWLPASAKISLALKSRGVDVK